MVVIPIPALSVMSTPSPKYVQVLEEDLAHTGVPEFWADPKVGNL